jgi:hypothetical protein
MQHNFEYDLRLLRHLASAAKNPSHKAGVEDRITMELDDFPNCCGATIMHDLYNLDLREAKDIKEERLVHFAITSSDQREAVIALRTAKWQRVLTFRNPNTNRTLTLWSTKGRKVLTKS